ncbi:hypothetical protein BH24ACT5_BH24ACT5_20800 [soil metagenome]
MRTIPRVTVLTLLIAIASHTAAAVLAIRSPQWILAWHWALLAGAETALLVVAVGAPTWFTIRNFRLPGVFVSAMSAIILAPLPPIVRLDKRQVPHTMVLAIAIGIIVIAVVLAIGVRLPTRARPVRPDRSESWMALGVVGGAVVVFPVWIRSLGSIPILGLFGGTSGIDAALARDAALSKLSSTPLRLAVGTLRNLYLMFAVGWMVAATALGPRRDRTRTGWAIPAILALFVASAYALVTTERLILGEVGVVVLVAVVATSRRRAMTPAQLGTGIVALAAFPVLFGLRAGAGGLGATLSGLRRRLFFVPDDVMIRYFVEFPTSTPFLAGRSIPKISRLTGGQTFDLSVHIYQRYLQFDDRLVCNANASFLGVGWANGGLVGVAIWCAAAAAAVIMVERIVRGLPVRSGVAIRGVAVVQTVLLTSADVTRSLLGVASGFLDLVVFVVMLRAIDERMAVGRRAGTVATRRLAT